MIECIDYAVRLFLDYYILIAVVWSLGFGLLACKMFSVKTSYPWDYLRQVALNGVACGFGWAALAVFWHRHCGKNPCTFKELDLADFGVALIALLGISGHLPHFVTKGLDAVAGWMQRGASKEKN